MSLLFWRKTRNISIANESSNVEVNETNPLPVQIFSNDDEDAPKVRISQAYLPVVAGQTITRIVPLPGITTGSAHSDGDALGTPIVFQDVFRAEKCSGIVVGAFVIDKDDEGLQIDIPLFTRPIAGTADDSAFAPTDTELMTCRGVVAVSSFFNWDSNQFGQATNLGMWISTESPNLYSQVVARGAINIAAGSIPLVGLVVVPD